MDDQRFISRGFPAPPLPEDFPCGWGGWRTGPGFPWRSSPAGGCCPKTGRRSGAVESRPPPTSCGP